MRVLAFADANFLAHVSRALEVCKVLRDKHGIYIVGSGRINVAGMTEANMDRLCAAIKSVS